MPVAPTVSMPSSLSSLLGNCQSRTCTRLAIAIILARPEGCEHVANLSAIYQGTAESNLFQWSMDACDWHSPWFPIFFLHCRPKTDNTLWNCRTFAIVFEMQRRVKAAAQHSSTESRLCVHLHFTCNRNQVATLAPVRYRLSKGFS